VSAHHTFRALSAATVLVALVTGCSSANSDANRSSRGSAAGVLNIGMINGPQTDNSNPFLGTSAAATLGYRHMIYEPLVMPNDIRPERKGTPWLAKDWKWESNFTKVTITVDERAKWSDGKQLTAEDVAFTFDLIKRYPALNVYGVTYGGIAVEAGKVVLTFEESQFVNQSKILRTLIVPKHIWKSVDDPATWPNRKPLGSGPYTLKTFTPQTTTLQAAPSYWQDAGEGTPFHLLQRQQRTDHRSGQRQDGMVERLHAEPQAAVRRQGPRAPQALVPRRNRHPRPVAQHHEGSAERSGAAQGDGHGDRPQKLLDRAGYRLAGGVLKDPAGRAVKLTLTDPAGWNDYITGLSIIQSNIKPLGIDAKVETQSAEIWTASVANGDFDATLHWTNSGATAYDMYQNIMDGTLLQPVGKSAPLGNYGRFDSPPATKALKEYANATEDATRTKALNTLQKIMVEEVPVIPTAGAHLGAEYSTKNWVGWPTESDPYGPPEPTQPNALDIVLRRKPAK
jgi:peptide/nickel transport system substrate-binding protein